MPGGTGAPLPAPARTPSAARTSRPAQSTGRAAACSSADSDRCDSGGGIISSGSSWKMSAATSTLLAGSPGLMTNQPSSRARWAPSAVSSRSLALRAFSSGPWQRKQRSDSSGRILVVEADPPVRRRARCRRRGRLRRRPRGAGHRQQQRGQGRPGAGHQRGHRGILRSARSSRRRRFPAAAVRRESRHGIRASVLRAASGRSHARRRRRLPRGDAAPPLGPPLRAGSGAARHPGAVPPHRRHGPERGPPAAVALRGGLDANSSGGSGRAPRPRSVASTAAAPPPSGCRRSRRSAPTPASRFSNRRRRSS